MSEFLKQTASNFCQDPQIYQQFGSTMEQYEQIIYQQQGFGNNGPTFVFQNHNQNQNQLKFPQPNTLVDHFLRSNILGEQGYIFEKNDRGQLQNNQNQENIQNQEYVHNQEYPHTQPQQSNINQPNMMSMDHQLGNQFVPVPQNYLEYNANSKIFGQIEKQPNYLKEAQDTGTFQQTQMNYMRSLNDPKSNDQFKTNIQTLGGIEDTVGNMTNSLNKFEIKHLVNKNIRNYPLTDMEQLQKKQMEVQIAIQQKAQNQPHPFLYNPAQDKDRYISGNLKPPQPNFNIQMEQTQNSQYYQTMQQQQQQQHQYQQQFNQQNLQQESNIQQLMHFQSIENSKKLRHQRQQLLQNK